MATWDGSRKPGRPPDPFEKAPPAGAGMGQRPEPSEDVETETALDSGVLWALSHFPRFAPSMPWSGKKGSGEKS